MLLVNPVSVVTTVSFPLRGPQVSSLRLYGSVPWLSRENVTGVPVTRYGLVTRFYRVYVSTPLIN